MQERRWRTFSTSCEISCCNECGGAHESLFGSTPVIRNTFCHFPGIGRLTESCLWEEGVRDWHDLQSTPWATRPAIRDHIQSSETAWSRKDAEFFYRRLPASDRWRVFPDFGHRFAAVDIETTGLSLSAGITVIGIRYDGEYQAFIEGVNLKEAIPILEAAAGLLTFNGAVFDLPFLQRVFPSLRLPSAHLDLRFLARRAGLTGGLKHLERVAGFDRPGAIEGMDGYGAVVLWHQYLQGNRRALEYLVRYNAADTCVLHPLCEDIVQRLHAKLDGAPHPSSREQLAISGIVTPTVQVEQGALSIDGKPGLDLHPRPRSGGEGRGRGRPLHPHQRRIPPLAPPIEVLLQRMPAPSRRIVGIDLSGSETRRTGWALLQGNRVTTKGLRSTADILRETLAVKPDLVSIDSPLTLPTGRCCTSDDCECRKHGISRACERELRRRGVGVYWTLIRSMRALTQRGMAIAGELQRERIPVIESFPGAAQDILRIPRKRTSLAHLYHGLVCFGIKGLATLHEVTHDELDAVTSAIVGAFFLGDSYEALGSAGEGCLIIPVVPSAL